VKARKSLQYPFPSQRQAQHHFAVVLRTANTPDESFGLQAVDQFNCAMVTNLQALGEGSNRCPLVARQSLYCQERLVLLWLDSCSARNLLAKIQEAPDFIAKLR
jgi:hypothetical protein